MTFQFSRQGMAALPGQFARAPSSLVRRLVAAQDDPAKQRIRAWLAACDDERLSRFGLAAEDIALLRGFSDTAGGVEQPQPSRLSDETEIGPHHLTPPTVTGHIGGQSVHNLISAKTLGRAT
jgi:hypothetical protein